MQYDKEFKLQALQLSDEIGLKPAAQQLGINYYLPFRHPIKISGSVNWKRNFAKSNGQTIFSGRHSVFSQSAGRSKSP